MRLKLLTLALAMAAVSLPSHGEDLLDAYREARANDPVLMQADATRLSIGENVNQARALLLPQISAGLTLQQTNGGNNELVRDPSNPNEMINTSQFGHTRSRNMNAQLSQTVLDFSEYANLKAAHSAAQAQDELYQSALQQLYVRVTQAYFNVLTGEDQLAYAKANEDAYRQQYEQSNQRFKVGLSAITDVYQAKSYYEAAKANTIATENALNDAREALTEITGKPTGELKKLREDLPMQPPTPNDPDTWVKQALQTNPDLLAQRSNVETTEHNISAARAGHLPTITANVSYSKNASWYQNIGSGRQDNRGATTIGLTLNVPIFSGGATQSRVRQSIYQRDSAQDALESQRRQVVRTTLDNYRSVIAGISQVESTRAAVDSGKKALEATRAGFDVGTQTMTNVLIQIQNLTQAESEYSQARHEFVLNKLKLKQSSGTADIKDMEAINALLQ